MKSAFASFFTFLLAAPVFAAGSLTPSIVPVPQKLEQVDGMFKLRPATRIVTDSASGQTGEFLRARLHSSTGYSLKLEKTFAWRGMMLDVSRHFQNKDFIERYLDQMAMHKLNIFHCHFVDDQAWRQLFVQAWRIRSGEFPAGSRFDVPDPNQVIVCRRSVLVCSSFTCFGAFAVLGVCAGERRTRGKIHVGFDIWLAAVLAERHAFHEIAQGKPGRQRLDGPGDDAGTLAK